MRSFLVTIILAVFATISVALAVMRMSEEGLSRVLGLPPAQAGETLYDFPPAEAQRINLIGNGTSAQCVRTTGGWQLKTPWEDRMEPRAVQAIFQFTLGTRVEASIPADKLESANTGFKDGEIGFGFIDNEGDTIAKFIVGHKTAWVGTDPGTGSHVPTVFVAPRDKGRKDYLYACTDPGDILSIMSGGFKKLRDHHPFFFHPLSIEHLRVKKKTGELMLTQEKGNGVWNITKPLGLQSDADAVLKLVQGLFDLRAVNVMNRSEVTLPSADSKDVTEIGIRFYGTEEEITLTTYSPLTQDAVTVLATVSDRPSAVFELPIRSGPDPEGGKNLVGITELPLAVNSLRDATLTSIQFPGIKNILIRPDDSEPLIISRQSQKDVFSVLIEDDIVEPDTSALFGLVQTLNQTKVSEFVSDTATDLSPYGLDKPFLTLIFGSFKGERIHIDFGRDEQGSLHAIRNGTTTVFKIDQSLLANIPIRPWEWKNRQLLKVDAYDVTQITRALKDQPPLVLESNFISETWKAKQADEDRSVYLIKKRAERLRDNLLNLRVDTWLRPGHSLAEKALQDPDIILKITYQTVNDQGEEGPEETRSLSLAADAKNTTFYGMIDGESSPFLLGKAKALEFAEDLFSLD